MKTIEYRYDVKKNEPRLFKKELKFMDFYYVTHDYVNTTNLNDKTKREVMVRVHDFSLQLRDTFALYPIGKKANEKTYDKIASGLKESLRRAKISLALNKKNSKHFVSYWPFLAGTLKKDARLLKDEHLQNVISDFEKRTLDLKVKK